MEIGNTVRVNDFAAQLLVEDRPVAIGIRVNLESGKDRERIFIIKGLEHIHHFRPVAFEFSEAFVVKVDDVLNSLIRFGHVRPMGMSRDGAEIQLLSSVFQSLFQRTVTVGKTAVIVQIAE